MLALTTSVFSNYFFSIFKTWGHVKRGPSQTFGSQRAAWPSNSCPKRSFPRRLCSLFPGSSFPYFTRQSKQELFAPGAKGPASFKILPQLYNKTRNKLLLGESQFIFIGCSKSCCWLCWCLFWGFYKRWFVLSYFIFICLVWISYILFRCVNFLWIEAFTLGKFLIYVFPNIPYVNFFLACLFLNF